MRTVEEQLEIVLPEVVPPVANYAPAVRSGVMVYTSGQLPVIDGRLGATGKVGAEVDPDRATELARQCALNALAAIHALVGIDAVSRVLKVTGFVASADSYTDQPRVVNGASNLLGEIFGAQGAHVRSAVGVAQLPLGSPVEIEIVVEINGEKHYAPNQYAVYYNGVAVPEDRYTIRHEIKARKARVASRYKHTLGRDDSVTAAMRNTAMQQA